MTKNEGKICNRSVLSHDSLLAASEQYAWCCDLDDEWWKTNSLSPHPSLWSAVFATRCWTREILRWGVGQVYEGNEAMFMSFESLTLAWVEFLESRGIAVGSLVQLPKLHSFGTERSRIWIGKPAASAKFLKIWKIVEIDRIIFGNSDIVRIK